ncbi:Fructose-bisphosphate aldolase [Fusarium oxysporum f. sp. albedinis]|nr:Fructose-bisphosphate aldolase [Fusarium oxysporum f. sp. albedinis]
MSSPRGFQESGRSRNIAWIRRSAVSTKPLAYGLELAEDPVQGAFHAVGEPHLFPAVHITQITAFETFIPSRLFFSGLENPSSGPRARCNTQFTFCHFQHLMEHDPSALP